MSTRDVGEIIWESTEKVCKQTLLQCEKDVPGYRNGVHIELDVRNMLSTLLDPHSYSIRDIVRNKKYVK